MVTDFELRLLAEMAYLDELNGKNSEQRVKNPNSFKIKKDKIKPSSDFIRKAEIVIKKWSLVTTFREFNDLFINAELDAYLFKNTNGFYVFVYRGTNLKPKQLKYDMKENLNMFFSSEIDEKNSQFWQAYLFTSTCIKTFKIDPSLVILTGHSKGGAIAAKIGFLHSLKEGSILKVRTFTPALVEISHLIYRDKPKVNLDCTNYVIKGDNVINLLSKVRFVIFIFSFTLYKIFHSKNKTKFRWENILLLWNIWTMQPYIGRVKIFTPHKRSVLRHSLNLFDDHFDDRGMLKL